MTFLGLSRFRLVHFFAALVIAKPAERVIPDDGHGQVRRPFADLGLRDWHTIPYTKNAKAICDFKL